MSLNPREQKLSKKGVREALTLAHEAAALGAGAGEIARDRRSHSRWVRSGSFPGHWAGTAAAGSAGRRPPALVGRNWHVFIAELKTLMQEGLRVMSVDLSQVSRMGQSEAHLLMEVRDRLKRNQRTLALIGVSPAAILAVSRASTLRRTRAAHR